MVLYDKETIWRLFMFKNFNKMSVLVGITVFILGLNLAGGILDQSYIQEVEAQEALELAEAERIKAQEALIDEEMEMLLEAELAVPDSVAALLIGLDRSEGLTDVLMVGYLDTDTNQVKIVSVPRDLFIDFREAHFKEIKENNPKNRVLYCKLNEVYNYLGQDQAGLEDLRDIIEVITGIEIKHMMTIDIDGFKDVVDVMGGIEFDVPQDMRYSDPEQDLYINLKAGWQHLDGDKAEQLVRYRRYPRGDLQRIEMQQLVVQALIDKALKIESIDRWIALATKVFAIFKADFGLLLALDYVEYIFEQDLKELISTEHMVTIPSWGELIDEIWYQYWDIEEAHSMVEELIERD